MVHAAVVKKWGTSPEYADIDLVEPTESQVHIKVLAAGLHTLVRSRAKGTHFSVANKPPPHVLGADGVGSIIPSGELVYFNCLTAPSGSFAEEIVVEKRDTFRLPTGTDPDTIAVLANPAMSSWMALTARAGIDPSQHASFSVAIVGATGVSGRVAVQIAKAMGANRIVAIGKPGPKLQRTIELGATSTIALSQSASEVDLADAADVDVVLDYLWGDVASIVLPGIIAKRANKSQRLSWVEIGSLAGDENSVSASLLRSANLAVLGCGPGSWSFQELNAQLPAMLDAIVANQLSADFAVKALANVEDWWEGAEGPRRLIKP